MELSIKLKQSCEELVSLIESGGREISITDNIDVLQTYSKRINYLSNQFIINIGSNNNKIAFKTLTSIFKYTKVMELAIKSNENQFDLLIQEKDQSLKDLGIEKEKTETEQQVENLEKAITQKRNRQMVKIFVFAIIALVGTVLTKSDMSNRELLNWMVKRDNRAIKQLRSQCNTLEDSHSSVTLELIVANSNLLCASLRLQYLESEMAANEEKKVGLGRGLTHLINIKSLLHSIGEIFGQLASETEFTRSVIKELKYDQYWLKITMVLYKYSKPIMNDALLKSCK
ncbi:hypothetical protein DFA_09866 [Cavenderia fasciculata]|uniref:Uncharacterized protein n=1 Tax=Cavenderia fasciculata TaxID=261658 RepID=F4QAY4_CACFS|nr:uncharacterized protein DFA_09866 [Cavenderia fasciculata]EGG15043.1 hypothetical protein DFA_09866 [Cavenderia fasciculata]|eukprot:XP_004351763.1 hypothetical protein DFA_09866 [Cavenderia fasciculata]